MWGGGVTAWKLAALFKIENIATIKFYMYNVLYIACVCGLRSHQKQFERSQVLKIFLGENTAIYTIRFPLQQILYENLIYFSPLLNLTITAFAPS